MPTGGTEMSHLRAGREFVRTKLYTVFFKKILDKIQNLMYNLSVKRKERWNA